MPSKNDGSRRRPTSRPPLPLFAAVASFSSSVAPPIPFRQFNTPKIEKHNRSSLKIRNNLKNNHQALADCFAPGAACASRLVFAADKLRGTPQEAEALRLAIATIKEVHFKGERGRIKASTAVGRVFVLLTSKKKNSFLSFQATTDTAKFSELSTRLFSLGLGDPGLDAEAQQWISQTDAAANSERDELEGEAARAKAAVDRAAVRASAVALGDWHARRGEPQAALRSFLRARDYCSTPRDVAEVCLRAASTAAAAGSWAHVSSYASRAASAAATAPAAGASNDLSSPPAPPAAAAAPPVISSAAVATALAGCAAAAFDAGRWREAALGFVKAADAADVDGGGVAGVGGGVIVAAGSTSSSYPLDADAACAPSLASPLDVALSGGLACLASLDRAELSSVALASPGFRDALSSLLPALLAAVEACAAARFGDCLALLRERVLPRARLDARASRAAPGLAAQAARRCLVQYAAPYSALSLDAARARLGFASRAELDEELAALVRKGAVKGRLDVPGGLLTKEAGVGGSGGGGDAADGGGSSKLHQQQQDVPPRSAIDAALEAGLAYVADSRALLLRAAMLSKGMVEQLPASAPATTAAAATTPGAGGGGGGGSAAAGGRTRRGGSGEQRPQRSGRERAAAMT